MKLAQIRLSFYLRALSERWIGFSEDDVKTIAEGAKKV
jgi:hypothetical protein